MRPWACRPPDEGIDGPIPALEAIDAFVDELRVEAGIAAGPAATLSPREVEVLRLLAGGMTNGQIAEKLVVSPNTAAKHVARILAKTGAANRAEATAFAFRHRLV